MAREMPGNPSSRVNHGSQLLTPPPAHLVSYSTSLVRNNPYAPTGHLPAQRRDHPGRGRRRLAERYRGPMPPPKPNLPRANPSRHVPTRKWCAARWRTGCAPCRRCRCPTRWPGPANANSPPHARLIAPPGMPLVLAVAEWCRCRLPRPTRATLPANRYDGFWRRTLTGPRSLARHWDQVCLQMADDPTGVACSPDTASIADKGETAQREPRRNPRRMVPNYGIPDNLDRRVWKTARPLRLRCGQ